MKKIITFSAIVMIALAIPQSVKAYDFSAVAPTGQTLYYNIVNGAAIVTHQIQIENTFYSTYPTGNLTIPHRVTYAGNTYTVNAIGRDAFYGCSGLTHVNIPNTVTAIFDQAFANCSGLTSITIPNSVTLISSSVFIGCSGLTSMEVTSGNTHYDSRGNCNAIIETSHNYLIAGCQTTVIPNTVTYINSNAFEGHTGLTTITIPNSVHSIEHYAFKNCNGLTSITIPNSVTYMGQCIFQDCSRLISIVVETGNPNFDSRGNCNAIIRTNDNTLVEGCNTTVIPNTVTSIETHAFSGRSGLTSITIPNSVTSIGFSAFWNCISLPSVTIPNSVTTIRERAFENCSGLTSVTIGSSVDSIKWHAFAGCSGLTSITSLAIVPPHYFDCFGNNNIPVYVPCESVAAYQSAEGWGYFTNIQCIVENCDPITSFPWNNTFDEDLSCWKTVDADGDGYNWLHYQGWALSESYSYFDSTRNGLSPDNWLTSRRLEIPANGNYKLSWSAQGMDNNYYSEHYSVYVSTTGDNPSDFTTQLYSETLNTPNTVNRSVSLQNYRGQTVRIAFRHHNTTDKFILGIGNVKITQNTQSIDEIEENGVTVYAYDGRIVVEGAEGMEVRVYDMMGRMVAQSSGTYAPALTGTPSKFRVPTSGVYMVKIGNMPAQRVVVLK